jgi:hypothetical protein
MHEREPAEPQAAPEVPERALAGSQFAGILLLRGGQRDACLHVEKLRPAPLTR